MNKESVFKQYFKKRKKILILIVLFVGCFLVIGTSYAIWQLTIIQTESNLVNTTCFKIEFTEENDITLQNSYPITDDEGMSLTPYTFTIENICDTNATYQINLENLIVDGKRLSDEYLKLSLNDEVGKILSSLPEVSPTLLNAEVSHKLTTGVLKVGEKKAFTLRLWMDHDTPPIDEVMNATHESKVTVTLIHKENIPNITTLASEYLDGIKIQNTVSNLGNETLTYFYQLDGGDEIVSNDANYTFTGLNDGTYKVSVRIENQEGIIIQEESQDVVIAYAQVYVSSSGSDTIGIGSMENPFLTLQPAYNKVKSGGEVILLSNITSTSTTNMNIANKEVTLKSSGENTYSIKKANTLTAQILYLTNSNSLTITNISFDGNNIESTGSLLEVFSSTITLNYTTIQNNVNKGRQYSEMNASFGGGGAIFLKDGLLIMNEGTIIQNNKVNHPTLSFGGGILLINSEMRMNQGLIKSNVVTDSNNQKGGGIALLLGSTLRFYDGTISYNKASFGGGIFMGNGTLIDGVGKNCSLYMSGGTLEYNVAQKNVINGLGGGIHATCGTFTMSGGKVNNNSATEYGGGIFIAEDMIFNLQNGIISYNTAFDGGGVILTSSSLNIQMTMTNGTIENNQASNKGGGLRAYSGNNASVIAYIKGGTILNNKASLGANTHVDAGNTAQIIDQR